MEIETIIAGTAGLITGYAWSKHKASILKKSVLGVMKGFSEYFFYSKEENRKARSRQALDLRDNLGQLRTIISKQDKKADVGSINQCYSHLEKELLGE